MTLRAILCRFSPSFVLPASRGALALCASLALAVPPLAVAIPAAAQNIPNLGVNVPRPSGDMLLESDQLVYDYDVEVVSAVGNVKVYYGGYTLESDRLTYDQRSGRLVATGRVKLTEPGGTVINADTIDVTDDFAEGFVRSLRVETPDKTYFAADSSSRREGRYTEFDRGVYTACEPCRDHPEKPPLWQVRAARIVHDQTEKMVYFERASLEFFGLPVAFLPYFSTPDSTVKRKTGFLVPTVGYSEALGVGFGVPYYWAPAPNYDLTFSPMYYSRQGLLAAAEWRHRLHNGSYSLRLAGIVQQDGAAFLDGKGAGTFAQEDFRGGLRTTGRFDINRYWSFGWDGTVMTDRTFARNYDVLNNSLDFATSQAHLTGIRDRNFFDLRGYYFEVVRDSALPRYRQERQAVVHPVLDHHYVLNNPILGGQLSFDTNLTSLSRQESDPFTFAGGTYYHGIAGTFTRLSEQVTWQRSLVGPLGQVFTPFAYARGDAFFIDPLAVAAGLTTESSINRGMVAAGLEWRWPWLFTTPNGAHVVEPVIQVIARPDEMFAGILPNEDAQSLNFDDTNLLAWDKFSGYDRVEGGTRVNVALRYNGQFRGYNVDAIIGQSYQIAGTNPFAIPDIANTGVGSGLETDVSDFVGRVTVSNNHGQSLMARGRFDEGSFSLQRGQLEAQTVWGPLTAATGVAYQRSVPDENGVQKTSFVITGRASTRIGENWTVFGDAGYDLKSQALIRDSFGVAYADECLVLSVAYAETRDPYTDLKPNRSVLVRMQLRTLGDFGIGQPSL
jgi:LPS-assembly protein